ncbi:MAG: SDR family oxidoreductase [Deltaproteobacteria bacterium]|nr:SDR family oxidoreductase [Deltaproteobacteria bacterium]
MSWTITKDTVCLVTGASAGIGKETVRGLAERGATVLMAGRNPQRTEAVARELRRTTGNPRISHHIADFSSLDEVRGLAAAVTERHSALNVLINNAGGWHKERRDSHDGFENTFAVNHLAPFLLTHLLRDRLVDSAPARVITVSSILHSWARRIRFEDLDYRRGSPLFGVGPYVHSKLANVLFASELARRLEGTGVTSNSLHPGNVATSVVRDSQLLSLGIQVGRLFLRTPAQGARTTLHLATAPELQEVSGCYFADCRLRRPSRPARDEDAALRLWRVSRALCGLGGLCGLDGLGGLGDRDERPTVPPSATEGDRYEVIIRYREPVFARYAGLPVRTYEWQHKLRAADAAEAEQKGRAEFEVLRLASSVGWSRDIVEVRCRRLD